MRVRSIVLELERRIADGVYEVGGRLPTEPELVEEFAVSRTTVRGAVGDLQARGLVSREQGRGTFVRRNDRVSVSMLLEANLSVTDVISGSGRQPGTTGLSVGREFAPETVAAALRLPPRSRCIVVRRTRTADGVPAADSTDYLLDVPSLPADPHAYERSIYALLEAAHHRPVSTGTAHVEAVAALGETAARLQVPDNTPVLKLSQIHELAGGTPVMYSVISMRSDVVDVYVHRGQSQDGLLHESNPGSTPSPGRPVVPPGSAESPIRPT